MTASGHAVVGAAIATLIPNPVVSLPVALVSHFVCDKIPHWDVMTDKNKTKTQILFQSALDVLLGFALVGLIFIYFLQVSNPAIILLGAFTAQLPDWLELPYFVFGKHYPVFYQNYRIQSWIHDVWFDARLQAPWGIVTQIIVVAIFIWLAATK
ncbi:hypothetical protein HY085_02300 [Candidatus Gottesmanbacteria bacterium]|nr:hypothetical protein [Candidatus Gottesmanbacteria bacterium]